ncbi:hypothetical protein ACFOHS_16900 [Jhaorihella thermophila]
MTERIRGQQVTKPFFSGTTAKGDDIIVQARVARPGGPGKPAEAEDVTARMISPTGCGSTCGRTFCRWISTGRPRPSRAMSEFAVQREWR